MPDISNLFDVNAAVNSREQVIVHFAGGGGSCRGITSATGRVPNHASNHCAVALSMHRANHHGTRHHIEDVFLVDPRPIIRDGGPIGLAWFSPSCFPAGTMVLTEHGYAAIETLEIGTRVLTHLGRWRKITDTMQAVKPLWSVQAHGHPGLIASSEHPLYTRKLQRKWRTKPRGYERTLADPEWTAASKVEKGHYVATPVSMEALPIPEMERTHGAMTSFPVDERLLWLAGRYVGDGWTRFTKTRSEVMICCGYHEADELAKKLDMWPREGSKVANGELAWVRKNAPTSVVFTANSRALVQWLRTNFGHGVASKRFPAWAFGMEEFKQAALLEGYLSADGWSGNDVRGKVIRDATTVSPALAWSVKTLAASLGKACAVYRGREAGTTVIQGRTVNFKQNWCIRWRSAVEATHTQTFADDTHRWAPVRKVSDLRREDIVYNISVEEDETYVVEGLVVHNCTHFSKAKGGQPLDKRIRGLVLVMLKWAKVKSRIMFMENVEEVRTWGPLILMWKNGKQDWYPDPQQRGRTWQAFTAAMTTGVAADHPDLPFFMEVLAGISYQEVADALALPVTHPRVLKGLEARAGIKMKELVQGFGYDFEARELRASDYGAPTIRKRLYAVFRNDKRQIVWPAPSHGDPATLQEGDTRKPWRTMAGCIDWTRPCPSIFLRGKAAKKARCKRPLAEATLRRIAKGVDKYVLRSARPFIVSLTHQGGDRVEDIDQPVNTLTGAHRGEKALCTALVTECANGSSQRNMPIGEPMRTACAETKGGQFAAVTGTLVQIGYGEREGQEPRCLDPQVPLGTIVAGGGHHALAACSLVNLHSTNVSGNPVDQPGCTNSAGGQHHGLLAASIVRPFGQSIGSAVDVPAPTVMPGGAGKMDLMVYHMPKFITGSDGQPIDKPAPTITAGSHSPDTHGGAASTQGLVTASVVIQNNGGFNATPAHPVDSPVSTLGATGSQQQLLSASIVAFYGSEEDGQGVTEPARTTTAKARFSLVESQLNAPMMTQERIKGAERVARFLRRYGVEFEGEYAMVCGLVIVDLGLRMFTPRELFTAMGFPPSFIIDRGEFCDPITGEMTTRCLTKEEQIRMCGNAVCPDVAEALVRANAPEMCQGGAEHG